MKSIDLGGNQSLIPIKTNPKVTILKIKERSAIVKSLSIERLIFLPKACIPPGIYFPRNFPKKYPKTTTNPTFVNFI